MLPVQVAFNTTLGNYAGGAVFGALASFLVGLVVVALLTFSGRLGKPLWSNARNAPLWAWLSGLAGAFYVTSTILVTPAVGLTVVSASTIAGQLASALLVDNFGWLGFERRAINPVRVIGGAALLAAVLLVVRGGTQSNPQWPLAGVSFLGGAALTVGLGMSNTFRLYVRVPVAATLLNFAVGAVALLALTLSGIFGTPDPQGLAQTPWWGWLGGLLGAVYVTALIIASPVIGASLTSAAVIAGQLAVALALDAWGLFGLATHPITPLRLVGLVVLAAGVWAVQYTPRRSSVAESTSRLPPQ